jgi:hypothetical protein
MWDNRERFIPMYYKNDFFPFIQSTGRSEGTNARFKNNVGPTYSLVSFLREYQRIVDVIRNKENIDDSQSKQKMPKHLHHGYTVGAKSALDANHTASRTKLASHAQRANDVPVNFS